MSSVGEDAVRLAALAAAYDFDAAERDQRQMSWRDEIVDGWARRLEAGSRIIELGAGTGQAAARLVTQGFELTAVDLSPENVARCRKRGLSAIVADMGRLEDIGDADYQPPYDAAFAFNSLIHFPKAQLDPALTSIRRAVRPGASVLVTLWGGESGEGVWEDDWCDPPRFFATYDNDEAAALEFTGYERRRLDILDNADELGLHSLVFELLAT